MSDIVVTTFDWVPEAPRGYVRDLRLRWALEEAGLPYRVESVPFRDRGPEHFAHQPFGQVPWLAEGELSMFETGAILLHLGERSTALLSHDPARRAQTLEWLFAALNSMEMVTVPWSFLGFSGDRSSPAFTKLDAWLGVRLDRVEPILASREWLAGSFSIADIAMTDVLRLVARFERLGAHPACRDYVARATARRAFVKAHADQLAHFAASDSLPAYAST